MKILASAIAVAAAVFLGPQKDESPILKAGAPFLFTGADIEGADDAGITGTMNGVTFHYYAVRSSSVFGNHAARTRVSRPSLR